MCGICGIVNLHDQSPIDPALLRQMIGALYHRGPDENGGFRDGQVALGHTRLSIIDLSSGQQPMCNENGQLWIVFNGEIFNYVELGEQLRSAGHQFKTKSDTEVILHAYEQWGERCVEKFNGQFAFAIWHRRERRLFLARDRVGVRPLYYTVAGGRLLFSSEIKAILQDPAVPRAIDPQGLSQIFSFWAPVAPRTVLAGIKQLSPGSTLIVEKGQLHQQEYWHPRFHLTSAPHSYASPAELKNLAAALRDHLEEATRLRMTRADVPVGVYLSGGIDSSVIGALVRRFHQGPLRTFSLRFKNRDFDEGQYQKLMSERLNTEHQSVEVDYADIANAFREVIWCTETPILRTAPAPLFLLSRLVRQSGYKVVLTGEGSDEFLGGYDIFRENKVRRFMARQPQSTMRPRLLERLYPWLARSPREAQSLQRAFFGKGHDALLQPHYSHIPRWESAASLQRFFSEDTTAALQNFRVVDDFLANLPEEVAAFEPLGQAQYVEIVTLLSGYLLSSQGDRMLMGNSVEGRFPFLDQQVMDFANALPPEAKLHVLDEKHLLKRAAEDLLPPEILRRSKQPYRAPDAQSFVQENAPSYVAEALDEKTVKEAGIFNPAAVRHLYDKCQRMREQTPSNADNMALVGILSTQLVWQMLIAGQGPTIKVPEALNTWVDLH